MFLLQKSFFIFGRQIGVFVFNVRKTNQQKNSKKQRNNKHDFDKIQRWIGRKYPKLEQVSDGKIHLIFVLAKSDEIILMQPAFELTPNAICIKSYR